MMFVSKFDNLLAL